MIILRSHLKLNWQLEGRLPFRVCHPMYYFSLSPPESDGDQATFRSRLGICHGG
jgi:hypothetical protein